MFPHKSSRRTLWCALAALFLLFNACASKPKAGGVLTEQKVLETLAEIDKAAMRKDADAIADYFSEYAQIKMNIKGFGVGNKSITFDRDQYRDYAKQSYAAIESYDYARKDTVIKISADGQTATATDQVFENAMVMGRNIRAVTLETATFKMEDGKVVISYLEGDMRED